MRSREVAPLCFHHQRTQNNERMAIAGICKLLCCYRNFDGNHARWKMRKALRKGKATDDLWELTGGLIAR